MRLLLATLAYLVATCVTADAQRPEDAVAYIRVGVTDPATQARRALTTGSGFLIDKRGHIVTARHVVMHKEQEEPGPRWVMVSLRDRDANPFPAQIVACEAGNIDLCLVKVSDASVAAANVATVFNPACRHLARRESVVAYGYPFGAANPVISVPGEVTGDLATELKHPSNVHIIPGMSGGPVVDASGRAIAVNAAGGKDAASGKEYPTITFLQPLIYGEALIRKAGVACDALTPTTAAATACADRTHRVDRVQLSLNEPSASLRDYLDTIQADTGCRIVSVVPSIRSANNATGPTVNLGPDGAAAIVSYSLQSGPFYDRYRGWLDAELAVKQAPKP